ncbi:hypothetical protein RMR41_11165, partial [Pseudomonas aeruginosa]|nr:hypothetical protein [Pseudomonas aeruginosa]
LHRLGLESHQAVSFLLPNLPQTHYVIWGGEAAGIVNAINPLLKDARISHTWGGNLGMARRFRPHMLLDRASGIALSGGYGGEGVGASNLGGRTLAALILGEDSELLRQPWVLGERPLDSLARWEPEPCRWLGYNAIIRSFVHEDRVLADPHSAPWRRSLAQTLAAGMESLMR